MRSSTATSRHGVDGKFTKFRKGSGECGSFGKSRWGGEEFSLLLLVRYHLEHPAYFIPPPSPPSLSSSFPCSSPTCNTQNNLTQHGTTPFFAESGAQSSTFLPSRTFPGAASVTKPASTKSRTAESILVKIRNVGPASSMLVRSSKLQALSPSAHVPPSQQHHIL